MNIPTYLSFNLAASLVELTDNVQWEHTYDIDAESFRECVLFSSVLCSESSLSSFKID